MLTAPRAWFSLAARFEHDALKFNALLPGFLDTPLGPRGRNR